MKNLLLILVILITGITNAQECYPHCPDGTVNSVVFDFSPENCGVTEEQYNFNEVKTELDGIVDTFFTELEYYNDAYVNYGGVYNQEAYDLKQSQLYLYPFDGIVRGDYNVTINTFPFVENNFGAAAEAETCSGYDPSGKIVINININESKWYLFTDDQVNYTGSSAPTSTNTTPTFGGASGTDTSILELKKKLLIYHELGHAVLGLDHPCNTEADIMNTTQCLRGDDPDSTLSFPQDFPVYNVTHFDNASKRMFLGTQGGQVYDQCEQQLVDAIRENTTTGGQARMNEITSLVNDLPEGWSITAIDNANGVAEVEILNASDVRKYKEPFYNRSFEELNPTQWNNVWVTVSERVIYHNFN